jgi:hypothetical protein
MPNIGYHKMPGDETFFLIYKNYQTTWKVAIEVPEL